MSLSLAAEPRRRGLFEPYLWTRSLPSQSTSVSLLPLLFSDPLPTLTLMDRSKLVRGRLDSDASDMQYLRSLDSQYARRLANNSKGSTMIKTLRNTSLWVKAAL
jgi:hypothetical protein